MAWIDVPAKLTQYDGEEYADDDAVSKLLNLFGADTVDDVPEHRREEFEEVLDYRLGACVNLAKSRAVRPKK